MLEVDESTSILEAALDNGIELPHDCKLGVCLTCPSKIVSGEIDQSQGTLDDSVVSKVRTLVGSSDQTLAHSWIPRFRPCERWRSSITNSALALLLGMSGTDNDIASSVDLIRSLVRSPPGEWTACPIRTSRLWNRGIRIFHLEDLSRCVSSAPASAWATWKITVITFRHRKYLADARSAINSASAQSQWGQHVGR